MKKQRTGISCTVLSILFAVFLIGAGISRYIETDSGNILIHDITVESYEGFPYGARLFRPLQGNSLNQRPSVLLIPGKLADRYTCDHIAMEFARRGYVALTMEDFSQGMTEGVPDYETENLADAGYTFLVTRTFTDHDRIGLIAYYDGAGKALAANHFSDFASIAFVSPNHTDLTAITEDAVVYTAKYETDPDYGSFVTGTGKNRVYPIGHADMLVNSGVLADLLEQFHTDLAVPNDSPFWFDAGSQRAQLLVGLRGGLLFLLVLICSGLNAAIAAGRSKWRIPGALVLPLLVFFLISQFMNFFLISVRLGTPFGYLPGFAQIKNHFSLPVLLAFIGVALIWALPLGKGRRNFYVCDIFGVIGALICLAGFLPAVVFGRSGWVVMGIQKFRWKIAFFSILACVFSFFLRFSKRYTGKAGRTCAVFHAAAAYMICCGIPAMALIQGSAGQVP